MENIANKRLRQIRNARHFQFALNLVFTAQWFRLGGQRCSLLNAALCNKRVQLNGSSI
ncbi:TPA: hypothetical protein I7745_22080 [Vibrio vulnificus]|nr:hypothetical protein [Vibrio vulnificus]